MRQASLIRSREAAVSIGGLRASELAVVAGTGLTTALMFLLVRDALIDDAYITLSYAKNLALHLHWGLVPHEVANSATSPLNVVLVAAATELTRIGGEADAVLATGIVSVAVTMAMAWSWTRIARALGLPLAAAAVGIALVIVNPFLLSSVGLEVLLVAALLTALLAVALERRVGWFGALAGLTLLARLDLILFVLPIAAATPAVRRRWARALGTVALIAGPWLVFSWLYFGSAFPDTFLIKTKQPSVWGEWSLFTGPLMYATIDHAARPVAVALAFAPAVLGLGALTAWFAARAARRESPALDPLAPAAALAAGGVAYYVVLSLVGLPPYHWYYVPPVTALSTFLAIGLGAWVSHTRERAGVRRAVPALALGIAALLALGAAARDVKHGTPWRGSLISTNFANPADYERVGEDLRRRLDGAAVESLGEIGTLAYYCECDMVDVFSDHAEVVPLAEDRIDHALPVFRQLLQLNYAWLDRDEKPRHRYYRLGYAPGPARGRDVWSVWSEWRGWGHIRLIPLLGAPPLG